MTDTELDLILKEILSVIPDAGESYVMGSPRSRGIRIQRSCLRERLKINDPMGRAIRKRGVVPRRVYSVAGANHLWHIDSNHKLIG